MENPIKTFYVVAVHENGAITTHLELPADLPEGLPQATVADVYETSRQIVDEFNRNLLVNKVTEALVQLLTPAPEETPQDKVREALNKRAAKADSDTPEE